MATFLRIHHFPKNGFVAVMNHDSGKGEFNLNKASLIARIDNILQRDGDVSAEKKALIALRKAERDEGRSILSQMADPWERNT